MTNDIGTCAHCGGRMLRVVYGKPVLGHPFWNSPDVIAGGCCIVPGSPVHQCEDCGQGEGSAGFAGPWAAQFDVLDALGRKHPTPRRSHGTTPPPHSHH